MLRRLCATSGALKFAVNAARSLRWTQPGTAVAATFVAKADPTNADALSTVPTIELPIIRIAPFRMTPR